MITYYLIGLLTGVSVTAFFIGKEYYKYYNKYQVQTKQLNRMLKLNRKINTIKNLNTADFQSANVEAIAS